LSTAKSAYVIPRGFWFEWVACPNYTAEIFGWVLFTVATQTAAAGLFTLVGAGQMFAWAMAKHSRLRRLFNGKDGKELYRVRYVLLPGVV
jgi:very-long-chain enoyl-CoA reductase